MSNKIHEFVKNESLAELAKFLNKNSKENKDELIFDPKEPEMEAIDAKKSGMAKVPEKLWQCINNLPAEIDKGRRKYWQFFSSIEFEPLLYWLTFTKLDDTFYRFI
uniref:Uncharacterized protein n=1 Tax=Rhizophagus irregularis (strain DAOM 181602 / DAOM 197198 / MUCL 43194) TaxID=747089 RepID=U9TZ82_RHIID